MNNFLEISANAQIATALILIVILLTYIAFREKSPRRKKA